MTNTRSRDRDYEIGYGRPPKSYQFQKGCSGNPKGRPKGSRNLKTDLLEELDEKITLSEGGRPRTLSKQRALLKSLMARAIKGDARSTSALLNLMVRVLDPSETETGDEEISADDIAILTNYKNRLLAGNNLATVASINKPERETANKCGSSKQKRKSQRQSKRRTK